jgi:glycosyltransferase involved in cell wall biosynthesis
MERVSSGSRPERVAIVYDRLNSWGGAERVLQTLLEIYPHAVLFTSVYDPAKTSWLKNTQVQTSFLQRWKWLRNRHRWIGWLMPLAFETLDLSGFDLVISVSSEAAKAVLTKPEQLHVCYLLTPTRYLWSHEREYRRTLPAVLQPGVRAAQSILQRWDKVAAQRPDFIIPLSQLVAERTEHFYTRKCEDPLYPGYIPFEESTQKVSIPFDSFFFAWGRHVPYKQFDLIIRTAEKLKKTLLIAGEGPETERLKKMADKYTHFLGRVPDSALADYLRKAECAIFPQLEDFGIAPLEALSQGCPVIVHKKSGVSELLQDGEDGVFIDQSSAGELRAALEKIEQKPWDRLDIQSRARQHAVESFKQKWKQKIQMLWEQHQQQLKGNL